jgi:hypothetical protein
LRHDALVLLIRLFLVLATLTWWVLPGMGVIDLTVTWDPGWPVMLEAGWGMFFTVGVGLPFLVAAVRPGLARVAMAQLVTVVATLALGLAAGEELTTAWWMAVLLLVELPALAVLARRAPRLRPGRPNPSLLLVVALAAVPAVHYAWEMAEKSRLTLVTADITNDVDHYAVQASVALALVVLPLVGAVWTATRRLLGTSAALIAGYLGVVSYAWPGTDAGFPAAWSLATVVWSAAVLLVSWAPWPALAESRDTPYDGGLA